MNAAVKKKKSHNKVFHQDILLFAPLYSLVKGQMSGAAVKRHIEVSVLRMAFLFIIPPCCWRQQRCLTSYSEHKAADWTWFSLGHCGSQSKLEHKVGLSHTSDLCLLSELWHFLPRQSCWYLGVRFLRCKAPTVAAEPQDNHYKAPFTLSAAGTSSLQT